MIASYKAQGCNMRQKVYFIRLHVSYFPKNLEVFNEKKGERFL